MFNPIKIHSENDYISETNSYNLELEIHLKNMKLHRPQIHENNGATKLMFPQEARLRNFTYAANSTVDIRIQYSHAIKYNFSMIFSTIWKYFSSLTILNILMKRPCVILFCLKSNCVIRFEVTKAFM